MSTATSIIEQATCLYLKAETAEREYAIRDGYSTVFTDLFEDVTEVTVDGNTITTDEYKAMFWDNRNASTYNSVVIDCLHGDNVTIKAKWVIPTELSDLITSLDTVLTSSKHSRVKSKKVEDFSITLNENSDVEQFLLDNSAIIDKYSICSIGNVRSGKVCRIWI